MDLKVTSKYFIFSEENNLKIRRHLNNLPYFIIVTTTRLTGLFLNHQPY